MKEAILITGATSDLGYEYFKKFEDKTVKIIALYFDFEERLDEIIEQKGLDIDKVFYDFSNLDMLESKLKIYNELYFISKVLHLAAPRLKQERFNKLQNSDFKEDFNIQLLPIVEIIKLVIPNMKKYKKGKILMILSSATIGIPPKFCASYVVGKYSLLGLIKALAAEYSKYNIQVNGISPSMMPTKFLLNMDERLVEKIKDDHPMKRYVKFEEIVNTINFFLSNENNFSTGTNFILAGGEVF